jgi:tetratricopeptide (TPR) repeat protein
VGIAHAFTGLTQATFRLGEIDEAQHFGHETLVAYQEIGDLWGVAIAFNNLGRMSAELGDDTRAKRFYQKGVAIYRQIGIKSGLANTLGNLGVACYNLGEEQLASEYLREALQIAWEIEAIPAVLENLVGLAPYLAKMGETGPSLELLAFVSHHPSAEHAVREKADKLFAELSADCSPQVVAAARAKAEDIDLDLVTQSMIERIKRQPE